MPPIVRPHLVSSGKLVELMPDWKLETEMLSLVRLGNRHVPKALRTFIDFAAARAQKMFANLPT